MQVIYESEDYAVLHINAHPYDKPLINLAEVSAVPVMPVEPEGDTSQLRMVRHGFEIVDKRAGREVYLDGSWAELFQENIIRWQRIGHSTARAEVSRPGTGFKPRENPGLAARVAGSL